VAVTLIHLFTIDFKVMPLSAKISAGMRARPYELAGFEARRCVRIPFQSVDHHLLPVVDQAVSIIISIMRKPAQS
jgi:hypothetical protein